MRGDYRSTAALAAVLLLAAAGAAEAQNADEQSRAITNGGIFVDGWTGRIDASEAAKGLVLNNARLARDGEGLRVTTGPAVAYWHPGNVASGDYTVKATFREDNFMALNSHPHPYGVFIGGKNLEGDQQQYLYCMAYGSGTFIMRGFGPAPFQLGGRRPTPHAAVNKAAGPGQPVTQEIAITVKGDEVSCSINGQVVATYPKSEVIGEGKLTSTDGVYGIRFGHNTDALVTGLALTRN